MVPYGILIIKKCVYVVGIVISYYVHHTSWEEIKHLFESSKRTK